MSTNNWWPVRDNGGLRLHGGGVPRRWIGGGEYLTSLGDASPFARNGPRSVETPVCPLRKEQLPARSKMLGLFAAAASFNAPTTMVGQSAVMVRTDIARVVPQMAMPSLKDAKGLSDEDISKEILTAQKVRWPPSDVPSLPHCTSIFTHPAHLLSRSCLSCARR